MTEHPADSILVVIPCLNEREHLPGVLAGLLADPLADRMIIVVVDGGSTDGTQAIATDVGSRAPQVVLLHNVQRLQSAGVNLAVRQFGADCRFMVRVDAHATYPAGYVSSLLAEQETTGADSIVVSMRAVGAGGVQQAIAIAQNSIFGTGGSSHRAASTGRWVEHGHHALFLREAFVEVGGYDETLSHNEDAELDMRLAAVGRRIFLAPILIDYSPRKSFKPLFRQYQNYGRGRARTSVMHRQLPNLRRWIVIGVLPAIVFLALSIFWWLLAIPFVLWAIVVLAFGFRFARQHGAATGLTAAAAGAVMQFGWSLGFHAQLLAELSRAIRSRFGRKTAALPL